MLLTETSPVTEKKTTCMNLITNLKGKTCCFPLKNKENGYFIGVLHMWPKSFRQIPVNTQEWGAVCDNTNHYAISPDYCHLIIIYLWSSDADEQNRQHKLLQNSGALCLFTPKALIICTHLAFTRLKPWTIKLKLLHATVLFYLDFLMFPAWCRPCEAWWANKKRKTSWANMKGQGVRRNVLIWKRHLTRREPQGILLCTWKDWKLTTSPFALPMMCILRASEHKAV